MKPTVFHVGSQGVIWMQRVSPYDIMSACHYSKTPFYRLDLQVLCNYFLNCQWLFIFSILTLYLQFCAVRPFIEKIGKCFVCGVGFFSGFFYVTDNCFYT